MTTQLKSLMAEALPLDPQERAQLAVSLIASLYSNRDVENAWADEVERRVREIEAGRAPLIPAANTIARARSAIR